MFLLSGFLWWYGCVFDVVIMIRDCWLIIIYSIILLCFFTIYLNILYINIKKNYILFSIFGIFNIFFKFNLIR